jgi:hypothetical protein
MIEIIRRRRNVWAGEQNVCFGQFIVYIIPSGFPSVLVSDNFFVESYFHTFLSKSDMVVPKAPQDYRQLHFSHLYWVPPFISLFPSSLITGFTNHLYSLISAVALIALLFFLIVTVMCLVFSWLGRWRLLGFLGGGMLFGSSFWLYNFVLRRPFCT